MPFSCPNILCTTTKHRHTKDDGTLAVQDFKISSCTSSCQETQAVQDIIPLSKNAYSVAKKSDVFKLIQKSISPFLINKF